MDPVPPAPQVSTSPVTPLIEPKSKVWVWILAGVSLLGTGIVGGVLLGKQLFSIPQLQPISQPTPTAPSPSETLVKEGTPNPTADWKTFSSSQFGFSFKHPDLDACCGLGGPVVGNPVSVVTMADKTTVIPNSDAPFDGIAIYAVSNGESLSLDQYIEKEKLALYEQFKIMADPNQPHQDQVSETSIAGQRAIVLTNYSWDGITRTYFMHTNQKYIIEISEKEKSPNHFSSYDQILSTFKFLDQNSDPEGKFCGGIAANLPQNQCPDGYTCKLENNYPDAGGVCTKDFRSGTLEAKVVRSPTCAGPVTGQKNCESPYADGTFKIMRLPGNEDIQTIKTDKYGTFTTSLNPGVYNLQNTESGIGKNIRNPSFTITGGKTTIQRFDVDTSIR